MMFLLLAAGRSRRPLLPCSTPKLGEMSRILMAACVVLLAMPLAAQQQDSTTPPPKQQKSSSSSSAQKKATPSAKKPSAAEQNPFPEAQSEAAERKEQQDHQQQDQDVTPSAPAPQQPDEPKPKSADQNPFPEEQSQKAAHQDQQQGSSSSSPGYSSSQSGLQGLDIPETNRDARAVREPNLGKKDTEVGMFYLKTADYKGAYERFIEATRIDPTNADAVFGLAESARHLDHRDEAIRNYRLYLSALPDGPKAKEARKGLKDLGVSPNS